MDQAAPPLDAQGGQVEVAPAPPASSQAPPVRPRHSGLVVESTLGVLGFAGQFRHVAPPAYWLHAQVGYEVLSWLMILAESELAFTTTGESQDASHAVAFPIYALGGGARVTIHVTESIALFAQGDLVGMAADVPRGTLANLGFHDAESLAPSFGGRAGVEWYQVDRHLACSAQGGLRDAQGFAKLASAEGTPLMWDAGGALRYTF